jgi:hypothetical protein
MRALENLLSHAPRDLMKSREGTLDKLLKQVGVKLDRLAGDGQEAYQAARVQFDFSYRAVREINRVTGDETVAMHVRFNASIQTLQADGSEARSVSMQLSGEMFLGSGQDPAGLFESTFGPKPTAEGIAAHALDRYAKRLDEDPEVEDTAENRRQYADLVRQAVERAAQRIGQRDGQEDESNAIADNISRTQEELDRMLERFVEQGLDALAPPSEQTAATLVYQRSLSFEMSRQTLLLSAYSRQGQSQSQDPPADPEEVDAAA